MTPPEPRGQPTLGGIGKLIDIDDPSSWPPAVHEWAHAHAERLRGRTCITGDLRGLEELEDELRALLAGSKLIAYHCTRLFDHEVAAVHGHGLRLLSEELVYERLARAHGKGLLNEDQFEFLQSVNLFARNEVKERDGRVWFVLGREGLDDHGVVSLLGTWGGEAIYFGAEDRELELTRLGCPAVVVAAIDLSSSWRVTTTFPWLANMFVGTLLGLEKRHADVLLPRPVPSDDIIAVWQPGDAEYDRHTDLPRQ